MKNKDLFSDIIYDSEINNGQTVMDCRSIAFYNESNKGKPMRVVAYKIYDGQLRIWLADIEFKSELIKSKKLIKQL